MNESVGFLKWLFEINHIRKKNVASLLAAFISSICLYFSQRHQEWFQELEEKHGGTGVIIALVVAFLLGFLVAWMLCSVAEGLYQKIASRRKAREAAEQEKLRVLRNLGSLSEWQWDFVLRFISENRTQIKDYEIGGYKAVWGPEIDVLVSKRIIRHYLHAGVYEIEPLYRDCLSCLVQDSRPGTGQLE